jgi:tetratricopeptide (TPR) repeat protein
MKFRNSVVCFGVLFAAVAQAAGTMDEEPSSKATATPSGPTTKTEPTKIDASAVQAKIQSMLDAKRYSEALVEIESALKAEPKNAVFLKNKGFALREQGKYKEAVQAYVDSLKINPELNEAKEYLAVTYLKMGEVKPAKQLYKELQSSSPELAKMLKAEADKLKIKL